MEQPIQFHWRLVQGGETEQASRVKLHELDKTPFPDIKLQSNFCHAAEHSGINSLLTAISYGYPDPMLLACALAPHSGKINFLVAIRSGIISPTYFVQQVNTFGAIYNGRILINIVAGHSPKEQEYYGDALSHNERYARTHEFLHICNQFWDRDIPVNFEGKYYKIREGNLRTSFNCSDSSRPYIFVAGGSKNAEELAIAHGNCWMRLPDRPEVIAKESKSALHEGIEVGLRMAIIARDTKDEAVQAANQLIDNVIVKYEETKKEKSFISNSDSVMMKNSHKLSDQEWLTPWLWTGAVKTFGATTIAFVGTPEEISDAIILYKRAGITQFIFSGWPKQKEMCYFGTKILPLVRAKEKLIAFN